MPKITKLCYGLKKFWRQNIGAKCTRKMLMKLTYLSAAFTTKDPQEQNDIEVIIVFLRFLDLCVKNCSLKW